MSAEIFKQDWVGAHMDAYVGHPHVQASIESQMDEGRPDAISSEFLAFAGIQSLYEACNV